MTNTQRTLALLRDYESRNVTFLEPNGSWPIVWDHAQGVYVWDAEGRKYLDLTAAFGVAAAGHANPHVVRAGQRQMARLLHAMGDVHPHALKARLARELSRITFERWADMPSKRQTVTASNRLPGQHLDALVSQHAKTIFCNSGFEAVEAALKTAKLATGKRGVIAFEGAYHGLGYGALNATHRNFFRAPFHNQLGQFGHFVPFPGEDQVPMHPRQARHPASRKEQSGVAESRATLLAIEKQVQRLLLRENIGAILVEPIQGRGGVRVPPREFLPLLRQKCDEHGALLILDEIYTGLGRTGRWFACEWSGVAPDLVCLGKALTGGFPVSACVGRADIMDAAWPPSRGEAIHTSTFLGHPVGCAMALAQIAEIRRQRLAERSARLGEWLMTSLCSELSNPLFQIGVRGEGLMVGIQLRHLDGSPASTETFDIIKRLLKRGFIALPEGEHGNVVSLMPPLIITRAQLATAVAALAATLNAWPG